MDDEDFSEFIQENLPYLESVSQIAGLKLAFAAGQLKGMERSMEIDRGRIQREVDLVYESEVTA